MEFYKHIINKLQNNQMVYLLTVVQNSGSSPGRQGFKMMVAQDGTISGSIGGGVMEYKLVEKAKKLLQNRENKTLLLKQIHQAKTPNSSGMICSGEQTVAFSALSGEHISSIQQLVTKKDKYYLHLSPNNVHFSSDSKTKNTIFTFNDENNWNYIEPINQPKTVYIIGSGHVGLATTELLKFLEFKVIVFDNRKNLNTFTENTFADKKEIIDYKNISNYVPNTANTYVIIMTNKYTDDKLVLEKLLQNQPIQYKYIGVLGSKSKIKTMFEAMQKEGFDTTVLKTVKAPIGLPIKSQTPQEIAVSIGAEIISIK